MVGGLVSREELYSLILSTNWVLFRIFPLLAHVPVFQISYYSITITLVSVSYSCFTLAVPMREVRFEIC